MSQAVQNLLRRLVLQTDELDLATVAIGDLRLSSYQSRMQKQQGKAFA